mgnify:CR=1 FL=1
MLSREELLKSPEYWFETIQNEIYRQVSEYLEKEGISQTELAERLGVTKGYVSQIMKGEFNYTLKKLIELSLAVGKVPVIDFKQADVFITEDRRSFDTLYIPMYPAYSGNSKTLSIASKSNFETTLPYNSSDNNIKVLVA